MPYLKLQLITLALLFSSQLVMAETRLLFNIFLPQTHFAWKEFGDWANEVHEATDGEVSFNFPAQSVSPPAGVFNAVRFGVADAGFVFNGFIARNWPATMLTQMPWLNHNDSAVLSTELWRQYEQHFSKVEQLNGVKLISMFHLGPTYLCSVSDKPISTLEELQTRRTWALPGTIAQILTQLDLSIISSPATQVQELASRNTIDAHLGLTMETIISFGVAPYTKSCLDIKPSLQSANFSIFINQRVWDRLPPRHQAAIESLSGSHLAHRLGSATNRAEDEARAMLEKMGVVFATPDPELIEALRGASEAVSQQWRAGIEARYAIDAQPILDTLRREVSDKSRAQ